MAKYYLVARQHAVRGESMGPGNVILKDIHPVLWASRGYTGITTTLLWWSEIPEEVALDPLVATWVHIET